MSEETADATTTRPATEAPKAEAEAGGGPVIVEEKKDESTGSSTVATTVSESETTTETEEKKDDNNTTSNTDTTNPQAPPVESAEEEIQKEESPDSSAKKEEISSESAAVTTNEEKVVEDGVVAAVSADTADTETPPPKLNHSFQPGDHVIRWEMLPIVWPIQVHGIVLEVNEQCVQICDFGLTAEMRQDETEKEVQENLDENAPKKHPRLQEAWDRVKPPDNRKKERITVHIITTQEEIKPWKKVHYGRGLFGMGNKDGEEGGEEGAGADGEGAPPPKKGAVIKEKVGNWWKRGLENLQHRREVRQAARQQREKEAKAAAAAAGGGTADGAAEAAGDDKTEQSEATESVKSATFEEESNNTETDNSEQQPPPESPTKTTAVRRESNTSSPSKNPAFLKGDFAAYHQDENGDTNDNSNSGSTMTKTTSDPSLSGKDTNKEQKNEKNKLPESDPPKLVLARTRLLLEQGENILPPYHPFKSNSECIAVFCKTGYWRTLQASVFLHSTAIGNAKSSMAMTLGVAASVPLLAPAVALAGAALVGAPYIVLNQSHKTWQETTIKLNEEFWKQAPNEVFVECIEHWSDLVDITNDDTSNKEGSNSGDTEDGATEEEKKPASQRFVSV